MGKASQKKINYNYKYNKDNYIMFSFRLNKETQKELIEKLQQEKNKAGYLAKLIQEDLNQK